MRVATFLIATGGFIVSCGSFLEVSHLTRRVETLENHRDQLVVLATAQSQNIDSLTTIVTGRPTPVPAKAKSAAQLYLEGYSARIDARPSLREAVGEPNAATTK